MSRAIPYDVVPDSALIDDGAVVEFEIDDMKSVLSKSGKLMFSTIFRAQEPKEYKGLTVYEYFVIGTDEDPEALDPNTWKQKAIRWKRLMKAANVPVQGDDEADCMAAKGCRFIAIVTQQEDKEGEYKGQVKNKLGRIYSIGERAPETPTAKPAAAAVPAMAANGGPPNRPWRPGQPK